MPCLDDLLSADLVRKRVLEFDLPFEIGLVGRAAYAVVLGTVCSAKDEMSIIENVPTERIKR